MISPELRAEIRRKFYGEHWKIGTIVSTLGVHHDTVCRAIEIERLGYRIARVCPSSLDPYKEFIVQTLEQYPRLRATRLHEMVRLRGFPGSVHIVRDYVREVRPAPRSEAFFRLSALPGEQAQADWASFGKMTLGHAERFLSCFIMVLAYSRAIFARFVLDMTMESFLRCHQEAFAFFGGTPRTVLYDNLKCAVLERIGDVIRFNPRHLEFAGHYHFMPVAVGIGRGNEKGRVERAIRYLRESFFAARRYQDLDDLNGQLAQWTQEIAHARILAGDVQNRTVAEAFAEERNRLLPLPQHPFPTACLLAVKSGKTPYIRFDCNDYSIPHTLVRTPLTLVADEHIVRILNGDIEVARHARSWERRRQVEHREHLEGLVREKRRAHEHRGRNHLFAACPNGETFMQHVALYGGHLGGTTARLLELLDTHGAAELDSALAEATQKTAFSARSVAYVLDQRQRLRHALPVVPVVLPDDPRVTSLVVSPRSLHAYDALCNKEGGES